MKWPWLCCVAVVTFVVVMADAQEDLPWWRTAVFYQVYPRSFKDSNGDGVGDLKGITEKAEYLSELGVTAIWISPIFKSPMADFGYDISDYRQIDPIFGTMEDLKELSEKLKTLNIKLLLDLVPNHSSDEHEWFQKSVRKEDPYTDYYVWHDGKIDNVTNQRSPPNNWISIFTGPTWTWNEERGQYYLHNFDKKQPDLNYRNPAVVQEMDDVIRFWLDLGVDGFRVDAVPFLFEDEELRDEPTREDGQLDHIYTQNLPETFELLRRWADIVYDYTAKDGKPRALFAEAYADIPTTLKYYGEGKESLLQPFNFQLLTSGNASTRASELKDLILTWVDALPSGTTPNWVIGNHDNGRIADRYGPEMVDAMNLLTGVLPGVKVVYNGEEIGMQNTFIRWDQTVDPSGRLLGPYRYQFGSRDPERTPMQWDDSPNAGFSSSKTTWLPVNPNYWWLNVEAQRSAESSHLKVFQAMTAVRNHTVMLRGDLSVLSPDEDTLVVVRTYQNVSFVLLINMGSYITSYTTQNLFSPLNLDFDMTVVTGSVHSGIEPGTFVKKSSASLSLRPKSAVLLQDIPYTL
ncbi:maltase 2-like [Homalodisca vitripennis]|uniref:maltase 2-like n=1 Tax=Homalodisca vitripennis TaxID=197043 RepID=UPI001EEB9A72|nr:maltase 2-like [Homalodisca vitripennis]